MPWGVLPDVSAIQCCCSTWVLWGIVKMEKASCYGVCCLPFLLPSASVLGLCSLGFFGLLFQKFLLGSPPSYFLPLPQAVRENKEMGWMGGKLLRGETEYGYLVEPAD